jgi:hypothetical protein
MVVSMLGTLSYAYRVRHAVSICENKTREFFSGGT